MSHQFRRAACHCVERESVVILRGPEGGPWLSSKHCQSRVVINGEKFPDIIQLTDPQDRLDRLHAVEFESDKSALAQFSGWLSYLAGKNEALYVTVIGMFETRVPLTELVQEQLPFKDNGFGHMGGAPAQILVKTMTDMRATRKR